MELTSEAARARFDRLLEVLPETVVALDFDGTLAPIVDDPERAEIHHRAPELLADLAAAVRAVAVVTGRPARQVLALGGLEELGARLLQDGCELHVLGQYGNERWSSTDRRIVSPRPPRGLASFQRELPGLLRRHDAEAAYVEEKGLAVAVHTRRLPDPEEAFARLREPLADLAERHGLAVEPGRLVIEVRAPGMHKGVAVRRLADELDARGFVFVGDDLGDVEAFAAVRELADGGMPTLLVCAASAEQSALVDLADVVVPGPDGVMELLRTLLAAA